MITQITDRERELAAENARLREVLKLALEALEFVQQDRECPSTTRTTITAIKQVLENKHE